MDTKVQIRFQVETDKILSIISNEIYDSPYALLRENIQNAYDALLMRAEEDNQFKLKDGIINIKMTDDKIDIIDNGVGMTENVLKNNYWKAGSSGKNNEQARKAGVIGTFGIGAMANFGVCSSLNVETKYFASEVGFATSAQKVNLDINKECIDFELLPPTTRVGTKVSVVLDIDKKLTVQNAKNYLEQFVKFLPVDVLFNNELISRVDYKVEVTPKTESLEKIKNICIDKNEFTCMVELYKTSSNRAYAVVNSITYQGIPVRGEVVLLQNAQTLVGFRNYFGLAAIPVNTTYQFGGIVNLDILQPTAGREAVSRESLAIVKHLLSLLELYISEEISAHLFADTNSSFANYISTNSRWDLAKNITIDLYPGSQKITLAAVAPLVNKAKYYKGKDQSVIETFSSGDQVLLVLSQNNPRRNIQEQYLANILKLSEIPDKVIVNKTYENHSLSYAEISFIIRVTSTLQEDYLLQDVEVKFAEISHGVPFYAQTDASSLTLFIAKSFPGIEPVLKCYDTAHDVYPGFIKDFVRVYLYDVIKKYIPSTTKDGIDALQNKLRRKKELYRLEFDDFGKIDNLLSDYVSGKTSFSEVLNVSNAMTRSQLETVAKESVSNVESEIPDLVDTPVNQSPVQHIDPTLQDYPASPPILRLESETHSKVLTVKNRLPQLNNFTLFLSVSQKLFNREQDFFLEPHKTKVIWGSHRIIYIFTSEKLNITLYYDIELKEQLTNNPVGGKCIPTTTIFTKDKIFIPVVDETIPAFEVVDNPKEFFVRYDYII